ncbi:hypothetical protein [Kluyvera sp. CHPC 1.2972]|uniref:hypothetical protein n=1 Tax=Kluyvera sp. CHPC 1.2972 TaxID=2995176 RepID=UPI002FD8163B
MMSKRLVLAAFALVALSGCAGKARHAQCQELKSEAAGSQFGAAMAGTYMARADADMDTARYERCEESFDLLQYQAQLQQQAQEQANKQANEQAQEKAQERHELLVERAKSPEMQKVLRAATLKDLVECEKSVTNESDKHADDVKAMSAYLCEKEVDRRVDTGKLSRSTVNKMLNQS